MGGKENGNSAVGREFPSGLLNIGRDGCNQQCMRVPTPDAGERAGRRKLRPRFLYLPDIRTHGHLRVLRRHADPDDPPDAILLDLTIDLAD